MTGFGVGEASVGVGAGSGGGAKVSVEIRATNHRFCDVRVATPTGLGEVAAFVEQLARERFARGRFDVAVRAEGLGAGALVLDRERARAAFRALEALRDELVPGAEVPLGLLATVPGLFVSGGDSAAAAVRDGVARAFEAAAAALDAMRAREGEALARDLAARLAATRGATSRIAERVPSVVEGHRRRLMERAERLRLPAELHDGGGRLEQEIALFADRVDVTEELTRLESHAAHFASLLAASEPAGRRLDFLLQEMAREANTIGAKAQDAEVAHAVVALKADVERMREQVQNVE